MPKKRKPSYLLHKSTGQARVRIDGKDHYLGPYGSAESRDQYDDLVAEWFARQGDVSRYKLTVDDLCILYMQHAKSYYRTKDGSETAEIVSLQHALRYLVKSFGTSRVRDFGPLKLKDVRQAMVDAGLVRTNINRQVQRIKRVFRWGVENELVPPQLYSALVAVPGLKKGRSEAIESDPVRPVDEGTIYDTLPYLPAPVAAMARLQLLTGARPGEISAMRPQDITIGTSGVWVYRPATHKTEHRGRERRIYIGPEGQDVLRPFLERDPDAYCFDPHESSKKATATKLHRYTKDSYRRAVARACVKAGVEQWSPNQLRHSRATQLRERYGIEAAQVVLGHSDPRVTEIYAEKDFEMASRIMGEVG